jgi:predicted nucleic acid-binding protein
MKLLIDTNILLRLSDPDHAHHEVARTAVDQLNALGHQGVLVPQVLYEYWVVATRPQEQNGLGADVATADADVAGWTQLFQLLLDERGMFTRWHELVTTYQVKGKNAHDTRLVAAMLRHGLTSLLTFNTADFARYSQITAHAPTAVAAGRIPE